MTLFLVSRMWIDGGLLNHFSWECRDSIGLHLRGKRVRGEDKNSKSVTKVNVALIVKKSDKAFKENFEEGTFQRIEKFAKQRKLEHLPIELLKAHVEYKLGLEVVEDEYGFTGVNIPDQNEGEYRWKRGRKTTVGVSKDENYDTKEAAAERYQNLLDKFKCQGMDFSCGDSDSFVLADGSKCQLTRGPGSERSHSPARSQASASSASQIAIAPGRNKSFPHLVENYETYIGELNHLDSIVVLRIYKKFCWVTSKLVCAFRNSGMFRW